uniref:Uncharacterized protein n=1 Tax=Rhizophora mucronata TaxID=61149 RepID=A0A2P2QJV6_RHIMU
MVTGYLCPKFPYENPNHQKISIAYHVDLFF